jgi:putative aldouronate transport system substrate-binding protein
MKRGLISKVLTITLVTALTVTSFAGCKKKTEEASSTPSIATDTPAKTGPGWKDDIKPITFDWYLNFAWFPNKWGVDATSQYITKKTGVNINFIVPSGNENEKLNTMIASNNLPDFVTLGWYEDGVKKMIEGGQVLALNKLADQYDPYFNTVADKEKLSWYKQDDGNVYGYPNASSSSGDIAKYKANMTSNQTLLVRKDMYEAIGKPEMRTQEGFLKALQLAKEKFPKVDGQPLIPLGTHEFSTTGCYSFEDYLANFLAIPREKDGKLFDRFNDTDYVSWLKTFRKANELGLLSQDIFIDKRAQMEEKIAKGRYFAMIYQRSDLAAQEAALYAKDKNSVYIAVDGPANSKQDAPLLAGPGISGWTLSMISKTTKDPARAIKFMSYLISEEGNKDLYLGEKGVSYDNIDGKDQFKPEVLNLLNTDRTAFDKKYGSSYTFWMLMDTNMNLAWAPASVEPSKQMEDWTKGKITSYSKYDGIDPTGDSEEAIASTKIKELWGKTLPQLLMSKTDADFDKLLGDFNGKRKTLGLDKVQAYQQSIVAKNTKKLGN